jgi:hypothetical protein
MDGQLTQLFAAKFPSAPCTDPGIQLERLRLYVCSRCAWSRRASANGIEKRIQPVRRIEAGWRRQRDLFIDGSSWLNLPDDLECLANNAIFDRGERD